MPDSESQQNETLEQFIWSPGTILQECYHCMSTGLSISKDPCLYCFGQGYIPHDCREE